MRQIPDVLSRLLHPSNSQYSEPIEDEISTLEFSSTVSEQQMKEKGVPGISSLDNSMDTINVLTLSQTASHTPLEDSLNDDFNAYDWIIEAI